MPVKSIISPILVGRSRQRDTLYQLADQAANGAGSIALVSGEAGMGKTRLIAALKQRAHARGWQILEGRSFEPDRALPYAPLLDMLRGFWANLSAEQLENELGHLSAELAQFAPELVTRLPHLALAPPLEPAQEKNRRFATLTQFLTSLAAERPVLIIVEDLHWSDETSLEFLQQFAAHLAERSILLVMTFRGEDTQPGLRHFLAALDRSRVAHELTLESLTRAEVDEMLRAIFELARPVRAEFLDAIYTLTEGNPFFIEEVLKALLAVGDIFYTGDAWDRKPIHELHIPRTVQDAVQRRSQELPGRTRQVLFLAAVFGRRFDFALLQTLLAMNEDELLQALKELVAAQLVVEESAERFAFRHALTREAVYAMLLAREQRRLHNQIAETLERMDAAGDSRTADLAYHFYNAGAWDKAMHYAQRAGEKAQTLYAPREALEHFNHAITAAAHLSNQVPSELYHARGHAYETLGNFDKARADYLAAQQAATVNQDGAAEWAALIDLGFLWASRDYAATGDYFQQALGRATASGEPRLVAHSLNRVGNWLANRQEPVEAQAKHLEALAIFESLSDAEGVAATLDLLGMANNIGGDLHQSSAYLERAIRRFEQLDDRRGLASALTTRLLRSPTYQTNTLVAAATLREGAADGERALAVAREIGQRSAEAYALWALASCVGSGGEYGRALQLAQAGRQLAEEIEHGQWLSASYFVLGALYLDLRASDEAQHALETGLKHAQASGSSFWQSNALGYLARVHLRRGDTVRARVLLDDALLGVQVKTSAQRGVQAARVELALAEGQPETALAMVGELIASAPNHTPETVIPRLERLRGEALRMLGRDEAAEAAFNAARSAAKTLGLRSLVWQIDLAREPLYARHARHEESDSARAEAEEMIAEIAASLEESALRDHFLKETHGLMERTLPPPRRKKSPIELSPRELEIAKLVARGKSSREIANELVLSQRTVETHVSNILAKLGFNARTQIAAWVAEHGLAKS